MNNNFRIVLLLFIVNIFSLKVKGQDVHFSQFNAIPMVLNPASTGFIPNKFRFGGVHRSQWTRFAPFSSNIISAEWSPKHETLINEEDKLGIGLIIVTDKTGFELGFNTTKVLGSIAFNKLVGPFYFGIGFQAGTYSRKINGLDHTFPDMFTGDPEHLDYTQKDNINLESYSHFDGNVGAIASYYFSSDGTRVYFGATLNHFENPTIFSNENETFVLDWQTTLGRIPASITYNLGSKIVFGYNLFSLTPQMIYKRQYGAQEYIFGTNLEYFTSHPRAILKKELIAGTYYRAGHDIMLMFGSRIGDYTFKVSYEINHTALSQAANGIIGAMEISLVYAPSPNLYR